MTRAVVADAGPLIGLARVDRLDLLRRLYRSTLVPPTVHVELALGSARPGAERLTKAFRNGWPRSHAVADAIAVAELASLLDPGESEAIVLAEQEQARFLLLDDARGRRVARGRGIPVIGVAGVLLAAKSRGVITSVGPILEALSRAGYRLAPRLIAAVLERAGE